MPHSLLNKYQYIRISTHKPLVMLSCAFAKLMFTSELCRQFLYTLANSPAVCFPSCVAIVPHRSVFMPLVLQVTRSRVVCAYTQLPKPLGGQLSMFVVPETVTTNLISLSQVHQFDFYLGLSRMNMTRQRWLNQLTHKWLELCMLSLYCSRVPA